MVEQAGGAHVGLWLVQVVSCVCVLHTLQFRRSLAQTSADKVPQSARMATLVSVVCDAWVGPRSFARLGLANCFLFTTRSFLKESL